jgi:hypothetical protein
MTELAGMVERMSVRRMQRLEQGRSRRDDFSARDVAWMCDLTTGAVGVCACVPDP